MDTASDHLTATGTVMGTLGYMSPVQLMGKDVDRRSALFAVGVMIVEVIPGRWPFRGATPGEMLTSIIMEP
ncbi:MAG: serine/threonine protein kinase, partial [Gemmatimonadota bacterium]